MFDSVMNLSIFGIDNFDYQRSNNFSLLELQEEFKGYYDGLAKHLFLTASGMEAVTSCIEYLLPVKGKIVIEKNLYSESALWLRLVERYEVVKVDMNDFKVFENEVSNANLVLLDNPNIFQQWFNVKKLVKIAHKYNVKVIVDNSIVSFFVYNPLKDGADIVVESYSKYVSGHGDLMAGAIIFGYDVKNMARLNAFLGWRGRVVSPVVGYMLKKRVMTLDLRMRQQEKNAKFIYKKLLKKGEDVRYCGKAACMLVMGRNRADGKVLKMFPMTSTYGTVCSMSTPSYRPDLYVENKDYLRLSVGTEDKELLWKDINTAWYGKGTV